MVSYLVHEEKVAELEKEKANLESLKEEFELDLCAIMPLRMRMKEAISRISERHLHEMRAFSGYTKNDRACIQGIAILMLYTDRNSTCWESDTQAIRRFLGHDRCFVMRMHEIDCDSIYLTSEE